MNFYTFWSAHFTRLLSCLLVDEDLSILWRADFYAFVAISWRFNIPPLNRALLVQSHIGSYTEVKFHTVG
jgi:hypothetical protein